MTVVCIPCAILIRGPRSRLDRSARPWVSVPLPAGDAAGMVTTAVAGSWSDLRGSARPRVSVPLPAGDAAGMVATAIAGSWSDLRGSARPRVSVSLLAGDVAGMVATAVSGSWSDLRGSARVLWQLTDSYVASRRLGWRAEVGLLWPCVAWSDVSRGTAGIGSIRALELGVSTPRGVGCARSVAVLSPCRGDGRADEEELKNGFHMGWMFEFNKFVARKGKH